ncbi:MAG: hypothetical protein CMJ78_04835 [Planctomycetaceae bacterium]|nr:hypothetical protein [Planctomycetaceae bacterium]
MKTNACIVSIAMLMALLSHVPASADETDDEKAATEIHPVALLPFQERGDDVKGMGSKVTDLLFVNLVANPNMYLVDREDLQKVVSEQELSVSGLVKPSAAVQIGQLTGAKILVTGSVLQAGERVYVVAKILGTETSRVIGESVKGDFEDELDELVEALSGKVANAIAKRANVLVAKSVKKDDQIEALKEILGDAKRPALAINVKERHIGQATIDPAAETELKLYATKLGFEVIDNSGKQKDVQVIISGQGFSQFATRHGNLVSVKARLEIKAVERQSGRVLAVERQTAIAIDTAEQIAGKAALQEAASKIAARLYTKLSKGKKKKK